MSTTLVVWGIVIYIVLACAIAWISRRGHFFSMYVCMRVCMYK